MNYIDVALIVVIVVIGFRGFASGFVAEFCSLAGILLGVFLASIFAHSVGNGLKGVYDFGSDTIHVTLGFVIVLLVCWAFFVLIGVLLAKKIEFLRLEFINKGLGFVLACVKVFFIFSFIAYAVSQITFIKENFAQTAREKSQMYVNMITIAQKIMHFPAVKATMQNLEDITDGKAGAASVGEAVQEAKNIVSQSIGDKGGK